MKIEDRINLTLVIKWYSYYKMRYSIEPGDGIYVKCYGLLSFARNIGKNATKVTKSVNNKYSQKLLDSAKTSTMHGMKTASKKAIQKSSRSN